jgi:hypothetical protein
MDGDAMTAPHHKEYCQVCTITPSQWRAVLWLCGVIGSALVYLGVAVGQLYASDHETVTRASVEIPALKAHADKNSERISEMEKNVSRIPDIQADVQDIKRLLMENKK